MFYSGKKSHILYYKKNPLHDFTRMIWEENSVVTTKTSMICIQRMQKLWNKIYFYFYKNTMLKKFVGYGVSCHKNSSKYVWSIEIVSRGGPPLKIGGLPLARRGVTEEVPAVGFCLGSGLFGSYNSD